ncbi:MAG: hypothetical protein ABSA79_01070 [Candidatus Bathyarchaeia archaeon]
MDFLEKRQLIERNTFLYGIFGDKFYKTSEIMGSQRVVLRQIALTREKQTKLQIERAINKWLHETFPKGAENKKGIKKKVTIGHGTVYGAISDLEKGGMLTGKEKRKYFGNPMLEYSLTRSGLCLSVLQLYYCPLEPKDREEIGKIAEIWGNIDPALFGKWKYLEQKFGKGVADNFLVLIAHLGSAEKELDTEEFREFTVNWLIEYISYVRDEYNWSKDDPEDLKQFFKQYGIDYDPNFSPDLALDTWLQVIREEPDLNKYLSSYVDYVFQAAQATLEWGNFLKGKIETMTTQSK